MKLLYDQGAALDTPNRTGVTALHRATAGRHCSAVKWLIEQGAKVDAEDVHGLTPLLIACSNADLQSMRLLSDAGSSFFHRANSWTTLHYACITQSEDVFEKVLTHDLDVNAVNHAGTTALHVVATNGWVAGAHRLLSAGASTDPVASDGMTPLIVACVQENSHIVACLLEERIFRPRIERDRGRSSWLSHVRIAR
jgi:ankyrin repeat protein